MVMFFSLDLHLLFGGNIPCPVCQFQQTSKLTIKKFFCVTYHQHSKPCVWRDLNSKASYQYPAFHFIPAKFLLDERTKCFLLQIWAGGWGEMDSKQLLQIVSFDQEVTSTPCFFGSDLFSDFCIYVHERYYSVFCFSSNVFSWIWYQGKAGLG